MTHGALDLLLVNFELRRRVPVWTRYWKWTNHRDRCGGYAVLCSGCWHQSLDDQAATATQAALARTNGYPTSGDAPHSGRREVHMPSLKADILGARLSLRLAPADQVQHGAYGNRIALCAQAGHDNIGAH